jgi:hypothetical protein
MPSSFEPFKAQIQGKVSCLLSSRLWGASIEIAINKKRQANDFILDATTCDILLGYSLHEVMLAKHIRG